MKRFAIAWGIGWLIAIVPVLLADLGIIREQTMQAVLMPGMIAAFQLGFQGDAAGVLVFVFSSLLYGTIAFPFLWLFKRRGLSKG